MTKWHESSIKPARLFSLMLIQKVQRRSLLIASLAFFPLVSTSFAQRQNARGDGPASPAEGVPVWKLAESLPYTPVGGGPVVYVIAYSTCPYTQAFNRDWQGKLGNLELRWILYPINDQTGNTTADAAVSRDPSVLMGILNGSHVSPPARSAPARINAINAVIAGMNQFNAIFAQNRHYHIISPTFIWKNGQQITVVRGYEKGNFEKLMLPSMLQGR